MKTKSLTLLSASCLLLLCGAVSCRSEQPSPAVPGGEETLSLSLGDYASKVGFAYYADEEVSWSPGDRVSVWYQNGTGGAWTTAPVSADAKIHLSGSGSRAKLAVYPPESATSFNMAGGSGAYGNVTTIRYPYEYDLAGRDENYAPAPLVALNDPARSGLQFYHVGGLLRVVLYGVPAGTMLIELRSNAAIAGDFPLLIPSGSESNAAGLPLSQSQWESRFGSDSWNDLFRPGQRYSVYIRISDSPLAAETDGITINIPIPQGKYRFSLVPCSGDKVPLDGTVYQIIHRNVEWECQRAGGLFFISSFRVDHPMNLDHAVHGKFSVSDTRQVYFAAGNLRVTYREQNGFYRFFIEGSQWEYATMIWPNVGYAQDGESVPISHFGWGTGGAGRAHLVSTDDGDYQEFTDWGLRFDAMGNDLYTSNNNGPWRVLSSDEWAYLLEQRDNHALLRGAARIWDTYNGEWRNGLIILPDNWRLPPGCSFRPVLEGDYAANTYTTDGNATGFDGLWSRMEKNGAVFLPAAGRRLGTVIEEVENIGRYWTPSPSSGSGGVSALHFSAAGVDPRGDSSPSEGYSVRLVRE